MIKSYPSPILKDKYQWQKKHYKKTKSMNTKEYLKYIQKQVESILKEKGYKQRQITSESFKLLKR